jgi:PRC-barrel domain protein
MRLSDVLGCEVVDRDGRRVGHVSDVRAVQDGPLIGTQAAFRADALLVGRGGFAERLGYIRGRVRGPWILRQLFERLESRAVFIAVDAIEAWDIDSRIIRLSATADNVARERLR